MLSNSRDHYNIQMRVTQMQSLQMLLALVEKKDDLLHCSVHEDKAFHGPIREAFTLGVENGLAWSGLASGTCREMMMI